MLDSQIEFGQKLIQTTMLSTRDDRADLSVQQDEEAVMNLQTSFFSKGNLSARSQYKQF